MKRRVHFDTFIVLMIHLFVLLIEYELLEHTVSNTSLWIYVAGTSTIVNLILEFWYLQKHKMITSIGGIFILLSYLFQCSYVILLMFGLMRKTDRFYTLFIPQYGMDAFQKGTNVAIIFIGCCFVGYVIGRKITDKKIHKIYRFNYESTKKLGWIMTVAFGAIYYYTVLQMMMSVRSAGTYIALSEYRTTSYYTTANSLHIYFFAGIFLLMNYYRHVNKNRIVFALLLFSVFSALLIMLTGARSRGVVYILLIALIWVKIGGKINFKQVILYTILGISLLQLLYAIRVTRQSGFSVSNVLSRFFDGGSIIYESLSEFGWSVFVTGILGSASSSLHPLDFWIREFGSIIPGSGSWGGVFLAPTVATGVEQRVHGGTTYIADFFYYYGYYGVFMMVIVGMWIALWDQRLEQYRRCGDYIHVAIIIGWANAMLNSIRSPATLNIKLLVYSYGIILILSLIARSGHIGIISTNDAFSMGDLDG